MNTNTNDKTIDDLLIEGFQEWLATEGAFVKAGLALDATDKALQVCWQAGAVFGVNLANERIDAILARAEGRAS